MIATLLIRELHMFQMRQKYDPLSICFLLLLFSTSLAASSHKVNLDFLPFFNYLYTYEIYTKHIFHDTKRNS